MTVPCSLPGSLPVAVPALADSPTTPGTTDATDDAFAAVLAALSGAIGAPVPQLPTQPVPTDEVSGGTAVEGACSPTTWSAATQRQTVPGIVPTTTGPGSARVDGTPASTVPGHGAGEAATATGPVGPWHATHGTEVRATTPATEHAPFQRLASTGTATATGTTSETAPAADAAEPTTPEADPTTPAAADQAEAPAVPAGVDATTQPPAPDLVATQVAASAAPAQVDAPDRPHGVGPAKHVQPAVLEAARGLRHEGGGRTSLVVRLDPPELGAVLVRLTVQDGRVDVQLRTPDLVARQDLQAQQQDVQQVLRDQGFDLSSFDVAHGDVFSGNQGDSPDRGTPQRSQRADGRMDDHRPVTDDGHAPEPSGTWL